MKKVSNGLKLIMAFVVIVVAAVYYYIKLPAINIHSQGFWGFIIFVMIIITIAQWIMNHKEGSTRYKDINNNTIKVPHFEFKTKAGSIIFKVLLNVTIAFVVVYVVGNVLSSPIINAAKYLSVLQKREEDISRWKDEGYALYARILGFRRQSSPLLSCLHKKSSIRA